MNPRDTDKFVNGLQFDSNGLLPAVVQSAETGEVLMVAYVNRESMQLTIETGEAHFWSRSRRQLWHKGETSGNTMAVKEVRVDCDADTVLFRVEPRGPACHTGNRSCFYRVVSVDGSLTEIQPADR